MNTKEFAERLDNFMNSLSAYSEEHEKMGKNLVRLMEEGEDLYTEIYNRSKKELTEQLAVIPQWEPKA